VTFDFYCTTEITTLIYLNYGKFGLKNNVVMHYKCNAMERSSKTE